MPIPAPSARIPVVTTASVFAAVSDILSTIQNLYKVANKQVVIKIQDEFYEIFEKGDVNELSRFSRQLDIIAEDYRAQSVQ